MATMKDIDSIRALISEEWSDWTQPVEITQEMVNTFADVTKDHQWIHVDVEKANAGPFGGPIAHGFLTLSLVSHFGFELGPHIDDVLGGLNYGGDKMRFLAPVPVGSMLHARQRIVEVTEKPTGLLMKREIAVHVVDNETPALIFESLALLLG